MIWINDEKEDFFFVLLTLIPFVVAGKIAIEKLIDAEVEQESRVIF
jgi:hypothetical protein